jgi:membrane-bound lytic murein transglycosylase MltF
MRIILVSHTSLDFYHLDRPTKRQKWTLEEDEALEKGMNEFLTSWRQILENDAVGDKVLQHRDQVGLKDRARNIRKKRERENVDVGIFSIAG